MKSEAYTKATLLDDTWLIITEMKQGSHTNWVFNVPLVLFAFRFTFGFTKSVLFCMFTHCTIVLLVFPSKWNISDQSLRRMNGYNGLLKRLQRVLGQIESLKTLHCLPVFLSPIMSPSLLLCFSLCFSIPFFTLLLGLVQRREYEDILTPSVLFSNRLTQ